MNILKTFLYLFALNVRIEQFNNRYSIIVETPCNDKDCREEHHIATCNGKDLSKTMLKCFIKVANMQGESEENIKEYRTQLFMAAQSDRVK